MVMASEETSMVNQMDLLPLFGGKLEHQSLYVYNINRS
jgi:hypothetical protein